MAASVSTTDSRIDGDAATTFAYPSFPQGLLLKRMRIKPKPPGARLQRLRKASWEKR